MQCQPTSIKHVSTPSRSFFTAANEPVFTKVVEVAPLYVIMNRTSAKLKLCQSYVVNEQDKMVTLSPEERMSFSWSSPDREKQVKFLAEGFAYWSAEFALQDAGVLSVQNLTSSGEKRFFKVTKKNL